MPSWKLVALGALTSLILVGCNSGQPRLYRVAIDKTPLGGTLAPTCYRNSSTPAPTNAVQEQNFRDQEDWVIWGGADQLEYLDVGHQSYELGDSPVIRVDNTIEGKDKTFAAAHSESRAIANQNVEARQTQITIKFDDYSASPKGTIALNSAYSCQKGGNVNCPSGDTGPAPAPPDAANCQAILNFVARRIDVQQITSYGNNPQ